MALIKIETIIKADIKSCFDIARNIDVHQESLKNSGEIAIAGKTSGLKGLGEWVSWEANHFGIVQHLTSKIIEFDSPNYFVDELAYGTFKSIRHEHIFRESNDKTIMTEKFYFEAPYGIIGRLANNLFLKKYVTKLLKVRNQFLREKVEEVYNS